MPLFNKYKTLINVVFLNNLKKQYNNKKSILKNKVIKNLFIIKSLPKLFACIHYVINTKWKQKNIKKLKWVKSSIFLILWANFKNPYIKIKNSRNVKSLYTHYMHGLNYLLTI